MKDVLHLLELQREAERRFVAEAANEPAFPRGWSAALLMAHIASWREQLRRALIEVSRGDPVSPPPADIDAVNDAELARNAGVSLEEASARADRLLGDLIELWTTLGDRPFPWYRARTTGEALIRNSYAHPGIHLAEHFIERGLRPRASRILEESVAELRSAEAPGHTLGSALYNLACFRAAEGRRDEALSLLEEAIPMRPDFREAAAEDKDLAPLKNDPRFQRLLG